MATDTRTHRQPASWWGAAVAVLPHAVRDRLGLVTSVSALTTGMGILVGALWPSMRATLADLQSALPPALSTVLARADMATPTGWVGAELLTIVAPGAVIAVAVVSGTRATAGEEETGTLGLLLGCPVSRESFLLAKWAAMVVHVAAASTATCVGLVLGSLVGDLGLARSGVLAVGLHLGLLGLVMGSAAIAVGAWTGSRRVTTTASLGLAGLAFALASFLPLSASLAEGARLSPWYYYNASDPLRNGVHPLHLAVLLVLTAVLLCSALLVLRRRDLR